MDFHQAAGGYLSYEMEKGREGYSSLHKTQATLESGGSHDYPSIGAFFRPLIYTVLGLGMKRAKPHKC
jgi:hypothetical protein